MSKLYTCYSPDGEKFELTRLNFLDATSNFGFTEKPPAPEGEDADEGEEGEGDDPDSEDSGADESPVENEEPVTEPEAEEPVVEEAVSEVAVEDAATEEASTEEAATEPPYNASDKDSVKAFLREKSVEFDGRSSLEDLLKLAEGVEA